jgi:predicted acyl esterase
MYPKIIIRDSADNFDRRWVGEPQPICFGQRCQHIQKIRQQPAPPGFDPIYRALIRNYVRGIAADDIINCFDTVPFVRHYEIAGQLVMDMFAVSAPQTSDIQYLFASVWYDNHPGTRSDYA